MAGSLLFVHGTGVRDISGSLEKIRGAAHANLGLTPDHVVGVEWGKQVGPPDLDVTPVLPVEIKTRALTDAPPAGDDDLQLWALLTVDPLAELRLLALVEGTGTSRTVAVGRQPDDVVFADTLADVATGIPAEVLADAAVTADVVSAAAREVAKSEELRTAAARRGSADPDLTEAAARAVVAHLLWSAQTALPGEAPAIAYRGAARDALVAAIVDLLPISRGGFSRLAGKLFGPLASRFATREAVRRRDQFMDPFSDFLRDVAYYVRRGDAVRQCIRDAIDGLPSDMPRVVLAHSLGGIAAVDLMADVKPPAIDLLVTVGSQAPYLYLLDSLESLRPGSTVRPFTPWMNFYDRNDLLSFCAERIFANETEIFDVEVSPGVPFPAAHSAYLDNSAVYGEIAARWPH